MASIGSFRAPHHMQPGQYRAGPGRAARAGHGLAGAPRIDPNKQTAENAELKVKDRIACQAMHAHPEVYASESSKKNILHNTFSATDYFKHWPEERRRKLSQVRLEPAPLPKAGSDSNLGRQADAHSSPLGPPSSVEDTSLNWFPARPKPSVLKQILDDPATPSEASLRDAFAEIDVVGSGKISQRELTWALRRCGIYASKQAVQGLVVYMGKDAEAELSQEDFITLFGHLQELGRESNVRNNLMVACIVRTCSCSLTVALFVMLVIFVRIEEDEDKVLYGLLRMGIIFCSVILGLFLLCFLAMPAMTLCCDSCSHLTAEVTSLVWWMWTGIRHIASGKEDRKTEELRARRAQQTTVNVQKKLAPPQPRGYRGSADEDGFDEEEEGGEGVGEAWGRGAGSGGRASLGSSVPAPPFMQASVVQAPYRDQPRWAQQAHRRSSGPAAPNIHDPEDAAFQAYHPSAYMAAARLMDVEEDEMFSTTAGSYPTVPARHQLRMGAAQWTTPQAPSYGLASR